MKRRTNAEFIEEVYNLVGDDYTVVGTYKGLKTKIEMKHNICGKKYFVAPDHFIYSGTRCPHCFGNNKKTHEEFLKELYDLHGNEYIWVEKEYVNLKTKVKIKHNIKECGHEYWVTPNNILNQNRKCPKCYGNFLKTQETFEKEIYDKYKSDYKVLGEYINSKTKILVKHMICGNEYYVTPSKILDGKQCPECSKFRPKKTNEQFLKDLFSVFGDEYTPLEDYKGAKEKILIQHNLCDNKYYVTPDNILQGKGCPNCMSLSKGEDKVMGLLIENNIIFKKEYTFDNLKFINKLRFDFAIFDNSKKLLGLVEYDGLVHYKPFKHSKISKKEAQENFEISQYRDKLKNKYCEENKIPLLRIPYTEYFNTENILKIFIEEIVSSI